MPQNGHFRKHEYHYKHKSLRYYNFNLLLFQAMRYRTVVCPEALILQGSLQRKGGANHVPGDVAKLGYIKIRSSTFMYLTTRDNSVNLP